MLYRKATFWKENGQNWHALSAENGRDLSMGILRDFEVDRVIAWAKTHKMTIVDQRSEAKGA